MKRQWTEKESWDWYDKRPWIVGCNFIPKDCTGFFDIWQEYEWDKKLVNMKEELRLAASIGMNSVRMVMPFFVWLEQRGSFMRHLEEYLSLINDLGLTLMCCFFDDCSRPKKHFKKPSFGPQPQPVPGYHGGHPPKELDAGDDPTGYTILDIPEYRDEIRRFVKDIVSVHSSDPRIIIWEVINEPGNGLRQNKSLPVMEDIFALIREQNPVQPVCAGPWVFIDHYQCFKKSDLEIEKRALELSDIVNFHFYGNLEDTKTVVKELTAWNRPMIISEWLHRCYQNKVETHLPYYKRNRIGCYNWGLVAGKTQTYEPWESVRTAPGADLSVWQHDLFHSNFTPYNPKEIEVFKTLTNMRR